MALLKVYRGNEKVITPAQLTFGDKELTFRLFVGGGDVRDLSNAIRGLIWIGTNTLPNENLMAGTRLDSLFKVINN